MKKAMTSFGALVAAGLIVAGCEKSENESAKKGLENAADKTKNVMGDVGSQVKEAGASAMDAGNAAAKALETQLEGYKDKIASLTSGASALNNADLNSMVKSVSDKYEEVKEKIAAAMKGDKSAMESLKSDGAKWMGELKDVYEKAMAKLKSLQGSVGH